MPASFIYYVIYEIVLSGIFKNLFGESKSPNILMFEQLKNNWFTIDESNFKPLSADKIQRRHRSYIKINLRGSNLIVRHDYKELAEQFLE